MGNIQPFDPEAIIFKIRGRILYMWFTASLASCGECNDGEYKTPWIFRSGSVKYMFKMPRKRLLKTNRVNLDENLMKQAIIHVFNGTYSERRAALIYEIKRSTLQSRIKKILQKKTKETYLRQNLQNPDDSGNESEMDDSDSAHYSSKYTVRQVFTNEEETALENYIKTCSDINYGLTCTDIEKLAYQYAIELGNCKIPPEWHENKQAKSGWRIGFMKRHSKLSLRKPESTSLSRATAFNKFKVDQFFENYRTVLNRYKFRPESIYNLDETGVTTVMKPVKIVSTKGKKQVSQVASAERGELVTFVGIINAIGQSLPPVYVFPRIRNLDDFLTDSPVSSIALGNKSGWMTGELFPYVLQHIVKHTKSSAENPILLLLDNHESHVNLKSVKFAKEHGIVLLSFPPHTSHRLQPLDVGVFGPFKSYCATAFNDWLTSNPGKTISVKIIAQLTKTPHLRAFTASNITASFTKAGLWPLNSLVFSKEDFASSYVTDRQLPQTENERTSSCAVGLFEHNNLEEAEAREPETETIQDEEDITQDENHTLQQSETPSNTPCCSGLQAKRPKLTPEMIRPFPKAGKRERKTKRQSGISRIYTDTPEKDRLEMMESLKQAKKEKSVTRNLFSSGGGLGKMKRNISMKKVTLESTSSEDEDDYRYSLNDDSFSDLSDNLEELPDSIRDEIQLDDFVLVKFHIRNSEVHFVGQIIHYDGKNANIKFLRRKGLSTTFYFPDVEDISENINIADIVLKLKPLSNNTTKRTSRLYKFGYNFDNLVVN